MFYQSTRNNQLRFTASEAIIQGIAPDGGLFIPDTIPTLPKDIFDMLGHMDYIERASYILSLFLDDFTEEEIHYCVRNAYAAEKFDSDNICPVSHLFPGLYMLELWHGPTCAFKDMALQILPYLMTTALKKTHQEEKIVILVATSGDTGKAALEGFKNVPHTEIITFYPENGVSAMQKRQMATQTGDNVQVCAIHGNFDDAQSAVKSILTDEDLQKEMTRRQLKFSSANSINWGRLLPQIIYYVSCYAELQKNEEILPGEAINIVVPTGNFGNILAAYFAKQMGLPVNKLICASNANNVLTEFIHNGIYDKNRPFYTTISPSMDILISSNLERLLYLLTGRNDGQICEWFHQLDTCGRYEVSQTIKNKLSEDFWADFCDDQETQNTIHHMFDKYSYVCDPHTAVAMSVYKKYQLATGDLTKTVIASTANPYKFASDVFNAIQQKNVNISPLSKQNEDEIVNELEKICNLEAPIQLTSLKAQPIRFRTVISKNEIKDFIKQSLNLK